jgi:predicted dehydrogenase
MNRPNPTSTGSTRRRFIQGSLAGAAWLASGAAPQALRAAEQSVPSRRKVSANDTLNVAAVGAGGRGADDIHDLMETGAVNMVALCDCDDRRASDTFQKFPKARRFRDWRKMFDELKDFDAVMCATPDHNHAIVSVAAMQLGKPVYCEKPLAHSVWEARRMAQVAAEKNLPTQMGTQGHAFEGSRRAVEIVRSGAIGEVRELHCWTDRPAGMWPQGIRRPSDTPPVPEGLDWDVWLGPAPKRPYNPVYVPFKWRGFWDFGTGGIGDMGIHNLDTAFWALELTATAKVKVRDCSPHYDDPAFKDTCPAWCIIDMEFPARGEKPPVKMTWYDGGKVPPKELFQGEPIPEHDGGSLVIGSKGTLFTRTWHGGENKDDMFVLLPRKQFRDHPAPAQTLPRVRSHHQEWVDACRGNGKPLSNFGYASVLTETLLLGNVALRTGGKTLDWDAKAMKARGCPEADPFIKPEFRKGWTI